MNDSNFSAAMTRRSFLLWTGAIAGAPLCPALAAESVDTAPQPYFAGVNRALEALAKLGSPVTAADAQQIAALTSQNDAAAVAAAEMILARYTLASVSLLSDRSIQISTGGAKRTLIEQGWQMFLVRIANPAGATKRVNFSQKYRRDLVPGSESGPLQRGGLMCVGGNSPACPWLRTELYEATPATSFNGGATVYPGITLSGVSIEYQVIQLLSRDSGYRRATFTLYTFPKSDTQPVESVYHELDFECLPSRTVMLRVLDADGRGCVASLTIKDKAGHIYPAQAMRLAPDMFFQEQVYRGDGESMRLPDRDYTVVARRGPEYLATLQTVTIDANHSSIDVKLQRWIDPAKWGWYSGDTHIHAAGCAHYDDPTQGVSPETIIRHVRGEGLAIGDVLSWGPGWDYQKQFFTGHAKSPPAELEHPELQTANNATLRPHTTSEDAESTLRYDVEVSGFPSSHCGHLVLLRLKDMDYPGTRVIDDWPSWNLPILQWAREQGAIVGYAHCGRGMAVDSNELPNYLIPPMDGNGTQEGIVDVTHGVIDFLSGCDTAPVAELNAWYHMLNCGFRMSMLGETDWPCYSGERVGVGRSYVRLEQRPTGDAGYEAWVRGLKEGRLYNGDGRGHFLDFKVNGRRSGEGDLAVKAPGATLHVEALVAARLEAKAPADMDMDWNRWHIENARIGMSREVAVELVVNGLMVDKTALVADGTPRSIKFKAPITRSSWVALRIMPSAHTHPVLVQVDGRPIRASKRSAQWCRACVDKVWEVKSPFMRESELPAAAEAFEHARKTYDKLISECEVA